MSLKYDVNLGHDAVPTLAPASVSSGESSTTSCGSLEGTSLFDVSSSSSTSSSTTSSSTCHAALPTVIQASHRRKVSFGDVTFRSYPVILGDHPDCVGPPLAFDWDFVREDNYDLEQYEAARAPRKHDEGLILDWFLRKRVLRCYAGVTEDEINERSLECARVRKNREQTRKSVTFKSSVRHALSRITGGILGEKPLKHKDRGVHICRHKRMEKASGGLATRQQIRC